MSKSKTAAAKEDQEYTKDSPKCQNCKHYTSNFECRSSYRGQVEFNKRCSIGGFAVQVTAWCINHVFKGGQK